jgi:outer membrane protein OmpA-like peptidoglycan-associated protein
MKAFALSIVATLAFTSCQTTNPYTGEAQRSKATSGAVIGALVGAAAGSLSGSGSTDRRQKAMVGAGIGALAGGGIGAYMDKQEAELRRELQGTGVSVTRSGDRIFLCHRSRHHAVVRICPAHRNNPLSVGGPFGCGLHPHGRSLCDGLRPHCH